MFKIHTRIDAQNHDSVILPLTRIHRCRLFRVGMTRSSTRRILCSTYQSVGYSRLFTFVHGPHSAGVRVSQTPQSLSI